MRMPTPVPPGGWTPPRELDRPLPRPVRLTGSGVALLVLGALLFFGGLAAGAALLRSVRRDEAAARRMLAEGRQTVGIVTRLWRTGSDSEEHHVAYRFTVESREYHTETTIDASHWLRLGVRSRIPVLYLPSSPLYNYPAADPPGHLDVWFAYFTGGLLTAAGLLLPMLAGYPHHMLSRGVLSRAVVSGTRIGRTDDNDEVQIVDYQYPIPGGRMGRGSYHTGGVPPLEGWVFCVLYNPRDPLHHIRYPSALVKVAAS